MSTEYDYERCIIEVGPTLKKRGVEDYQEIAANMCRMRVDEGTPRAVSYTHLTLPTTPYV